VNEEEKKLIDQPTQVTREKDRSPWTAHRSGDPPSPESSMRTRQWM